MPDCCSVTLALFYGIDFGFLFLKIFVILFLCTYYCMSGYTELLGNPVNPNSFIP